MPFTKEQILNVLNSVKSGLDKDAKAPKSLKKKINDKIAEVENE